MEEFRIITQSIAGADSCLLSVRILKMPEKWRNAGLLYKSKLGFHVKSVGSPELHNHTFYLRGINRSADNKTVFKKFRDINHLNNYLSELINTITELTKTNCLKTSCLNSTAISWKLSDKVKSNHPLTQIFL